MGSSVTKRSVVVAGQKTSVSLEDAFWRAFREIARRRGVRIADLVTAVDVDRRGNLSSAIRCAVLVDLQARLAETQADLATAAAAALPQPEAAA